MEELLSIYPDEMLPPDDDTAGTVTSGQRGDPTDLLRQAAAQIQAYLEAEQDDEDLAVATKLLAGIQSLLAKQQKEADGALGIGSAEKFVRKQALRGGF